MNGAKIATAIVGAVIVRPASNVEAPKVSRSSGSSGCVEYRLMNAAAPASTTAAVGGSRRTSVQTADHIEIRQVAKYV